VIEVLSMSNKLPGEGQRQYRQKQRELAAAAYRKGRYYLTLDYSEPPEPPLAGDDGKWARALLRQSKKRA
jgi:hypothetical protein